MTAVTIYSSGRAYRISIPAIQALRAHLRTSPEIKSIVGCERCQSVCFINSLCQCSAHYSKNNLGDYGNHHVIATPKEVLEIVTDCQGCEFSEEVA